MKLNEPLIRELARAERKTRSGYHPLNINQHIGLYLMQAWYSALKGGSPDIVQAHSIRIDEFIKMR